jgi:AmmeMemoRadiSam system protein B
MNVRLPAVAGTFYPADPRELAAYVDGLLDNAHPQTRATRAKAIVVPHAGYVYSGPIAASAYASLRTRKGEISRVVVLGPAHRVPLHGLALASVDAFRTPLGDVPVDAPTRDVLRDHAGVLVDDRPHHDEHSLEVQLPFLQRTLGSFSLVPLVVGRADDSIIADVVAGVWGGDETLIVVSTDLSHYENYASAARHDRATAAAIVACAVDDIGPYDACGAFPLRGLLRAANTRAVAPAVVDLRNSGDTAGPPDRVVGYGAFVLEESFA